jgi:integrase
MNTSRGQKKPLTEKQIKLIKNILSKEDDLRDYCLFSLQIDTMLRSSDVLQLKVDDISNHKGELNLEFTLKQKKTEKTIVVSISETTRDYLKRYLDQHDYKKRNDYLFTGQKFNWREKPLSLMAHTNLVKKWVDMIGLDRSEYSTHSLRRTKSTIIFEKTGNVEVVRQLLGHSNIGSTSRYLGIESKKCLDISKKIVL